MRQKPIKNAKDLPDWFSLDKYKETKDFMATDWLLSLRIRKNIFDAFVALECTGLPLSYFYELIPDLPSELADIRQAPLGKTGCDSWANIAANFSDGAVTAPVRTLKMSDIAAQCWADQVRDIEGEASEDERQRWIIATKPHPIPAGMLDEPFIPPNNPPNNPKASLMVNLHAKDGVLIDAFKQWLSNARAAKRQGINYLNWSRYGLLPYLDLMLWEKELDREITWVLKATAVGYTGEKSNFAKTVPPLAEEQIASLDELEAIAASELKSQ